MFPSVDTDKGVEINESFLQHFYQNYPEFIKRYKFPSVDCIIDALKIALKNNISKFGGC